MTAHNPTLAIGCRCAGLRFLLDDRDGVYEFDSRTNSFTHVQVNKPPSTDHALTGSQTAIRSPCSNFAIPAFERAFICFPSLALACIETQGAEEQFWVGGWAF